MEASACDAVFEAFAVARAAGVLTAYDTNLRLKLWPLARARAIIQAACAMSDIVLPGLDDAALLTGLDDPDAIVDVDVVAVAVLDLRVHVDGDHRSGGIEGDPPRPDDARTRHPDESRDLGLVGRRLRSRRPPG